MHNLILCKRKVQLWQKLEDTKNVTLLHPAASILPEAGRTAAVLELVQVEPIASKAPLSPAGCLRTVVTLQISEFLL